MELDPDFAADPYPAYARLRAQGPVHQVRTPDGDTVWLVLGYDACRAACQDARLSRDWPRSGDVGRITNTTGDDPALAHMLMADPPAHTRLRRLVAREFTQRRVRALHPRVTALAHELLDHMLAAEDRRADVIGSFAFPLPMTIICELLGVPELDRAAFRSWSNELVSRTSPRAEARAYQELNGYLPGLIDAKRARPGPDLLSALVHTVDEGGDRLSPDEILGTCGLLLIAGHETTVNLIGNGLRALFAHPEQLAALRADPDGLLPQTIEEILRYDGPVESSTPRLALESIDIGGAVIPRGATVLICMADANQDPGRFRDAHLFDIHRKPSGHLGFGHGIHHCLGAPLARLEGRVALGALLERCPGLALDTSGEHGARIPGMLLRGVRRLPVRW
nr:cytochrome P450 [Streptomyces coryli]